MVRTMDGMQLLQAALAHCNDNISELARRLHVDRQLVHHWKNSRGVPSWRREAVERVLADKQRAA